MTEDDIQRELREDRAGRLKAARIAAGFRFAAEAARRHRWVEVTYRSHENGTRPIDAEDADRYAAAFSKTGPKITGQQIMYTSGDDESEPPILAPNSVAVMGLIGAGSVIEPDFEQIPMDGIYQVEMPFPIPGDLVAFQVDGDSMLPYHADGDVVIVLREQEKNVEDFFGKEAAVLTAKGQRYIKRIQRGKTRSLVTLESFNAKPIENARLDWIGEIRAWIPADQIHRVAKTKKKPMVTAREARK